MLATAVSFEDGQQDNQRVRRVDRPDAQSHVEFNNSSGSSVKHRDSWFELNAQVNPWLYRLTVTRDLIFSKQSKIQKKND